MYVSATAQNKFPPGYIVKLNGDTVSGYLQAEASIQDLVKIEFKTEHSTSAMIFSSGDISAFGYAGGHIYRLISFENTIGDSSYLQTIFARNIVSGGYSLYTFKQDDRIFFVVLDITTSYFLSDYEVSQSGVLSDEGNSYAQLTQLAAACKAEDLKPAYVGYSEKSLSDFVVRLNQCVNPRMRTDSYYHEIPEKLYVVLYGGGMRTHNLEQWMGELILRFNYPKISKHLYFITGLMAGSISKQNPYRISGNDYTFKTGDNYLGLPFALQFHLLSGKIQPYLFGGGGGFLLDDINEDPFYTGPVHFKALQIKFFAGAGLEATVIKNMSLRISWWAGLYHQVPNLGLSYRF